MPSKFDAADPPGVAKMSAESSSLVYLFVWLDWVIERGESRPPPPESDVELDGRSCFESAETAL